MSLSRRSFMKVVSSGVVATSLVGCGNESNEDSSVSFNYGIASGDPLQNSVIIWTHVTAQSDAVTVQWQVSHDEGFVDIVQSGTFTTDRDRDYTVKVDVPNLTPDTHYFYRFIAGSATSPVGKTKTLAQDSIERVSFAVVSCSNYPAGYFNVYREIVKQHAEAPFDAVLHLGDYIYEYGSGEYATEDAAAMGREPSKGTECISLDDYRKRYAQYRQDPDLQSVHAQIPMIVVWDDHELANDTWSHGAENHDENEDGSFEIRRASAIAAWLEWLPVRENIVSSAVIYRQFTFGQLVDLTMLDTRQIARDEPYDYLTLPSPDDASIMQIIDKTKEESRSMIGSVQRQWLSQQVAQSEAKWPVLGQQVLMGRMTLPRTVMKAMMALFMATGEDKVAAMGAVNEAINAYLSAPENELDYLPYNLDAWDGYHAERERVFDIMSKSGERPFISLAGDTHNSWCSTLTNDNKEVVGLEFAGTSVSSPGLENYLGLPDDENAKLAQVLPSLMNDLQWTEIRHRGFLKVDFTETQVNANWCLISTVKSQDYEVIETKKGVTLNAKEITWV